MKPKDLRCPFVWEERRPVRERGVLFVPRYFFEHEAFGRLVWEEVFGNSNSVYVEFCSGNGAWLIERAEAHPEVNWVGVEMRFDRVQKIWAKRENRGLKNLLLVAGEAQPFARHYVEPASVANIYINFPDPWPKLRHEKHRLMQGPFVEELARILVPGGEVTFVTDDVPYLSQTVDEIARSPLLEPTQPAPHFETDVQGYGSSYFEQLWREMGRTIHHTVWRRACH